MRSVLQIAAVTHLLRARLQGAVAAGDLGGMLETEVTVSSLHPAALDDFAGGGALLNVFLLRVSQLRLATPPSRGEEGDAGPMLKVALSYLVSARAAHAFDAEVLLGEAMREFEDTALLTPTMILGEAASEALSPAPRSQLVAGALTQLGEQADPLRVMHQDLDLAAMTALWHALDTPLRPSALYEISPVELSRDAPGATP
jgi:hypothetical protein